MTGWLSVSSWPLEYTTAFSAAVAAIAAVVSVGASVWLLLRDHKRQYLRDRLVTGIELMSAFEELQRIGVYRRQRNHVPENQSIPEIDLIRAEARFQALLRASSEDLPITRGTAFRHIPFGGGNATERAYLEAAPGIGKPDRTSADDGHMRGV